MFWGKPEKPPLYKVEVSAFYYNKSLHGTTTAILFAEEHNVVIIILHAVKLGSE